MNAIGVMKRTTLFSAGLLCVTTVLLLTLFYLPYQSVHNKTVAAFDNEQMILANQAASEIESFFTVYSKALQYFATQPSIIRLDDSGRVLMADFLTIHALDLDAVRRIDASGKVLFNASDVPGITGETIFEPFRINVLRTTKQPVVSDVFTTAQGNHAFAFFYPIFDGDLFAGAIGFLIPYEGLVESHLRSIQLSDQGITMMVSRTGLGLYCPRQENIGRHVRESFGNEPEVLAICKKMMQGEQGSVSFSASFGPHGGTSPIIRYGIYVPVHLPGDNLWSILVASPENEVLIAMHGFRDQWVIVTVVALCAVILLSYLEARTIARNRAAEKQRMIEEQLVLLLDFAPIGIVIVSMEGRVTYANKVILDLMEVESVEDVLGCTPFKFVHSDYQEFIAERFNNLLKGQTNEAAIIQVVTTRSTVKDVEISSTPFVFREQTSIIIILRDVTEELKNAASQRRLVTAIEQANESVMITDHNGVIEYVNPFFTAVTGYSSEEVLGNNPRILKSGKHDPRFYKELWKTITHGHVWQGRFINCRKDGALFTEMATISPVRDVTGRITHFVAVKSDISHEVALEGKLRQAQKMESIGTLAGGIAHDFNNILGAILGFTDMALLRSEMDSELHDSLLHIRKGGKRAADLVQQILTFSRQSSMEKKPIKAAPLIRESLGLLRASLPSTIVIKKELQAEDVMILADATQLQQVVLNICTNAFQAMQELGGELTIRLEEVPFAENAHHATLPTDRLLRLSVEDTGPGMEPDVVNRIFDPFFTTKEPGKGTGMGLSVVHGILRDLGGEIRVDSTPGKGTIFTVFLPIVEPEEDGEEQQHLPLPLGTEHILVVDDEKDVLTITKMMLTHQGYEVTTAENPVKALEEIRTGRAEYDLVLTDQTMPQLTGLEFVREVHALRPELPVVICTGYSDKVNEESVKNVGAAGLMMKPVELRDLAVLIRKTLDAKQ